MTTTKEELEANYEEIQDELVKINQMSLELVSFITMEAFEVGYKPGPIVLHKFNELMRMYDMVTSKLTDNMEDSPEKAKLLDFAAKFKESREKVKSDKK